LIKDHGASNQSSRLYFPGLIRKAKVAKFSQ
jgi:hypothetical protein